MEPRVAALRDDETGTKDNLLSVNPLGPSVSDENTVEVGSHLLSTNPFMADQPDKEHGGMITSPMSSGSDAENGGKVKLRPGILKRSDESGGSQLSLGKLLLRTEMW